MHMVSVSRRHCHSGQQTPVALRYSRKETTSFCTRIECTPGTLVAVPHNPASNEAQNILLLDLPAGVTKAYNSLKRTSATRCLRFSLLSRLLLHTDKRESRLYLLELAGPKKGSGRNVQTKE